MKAETDGRRVIAPGHGGREASPRPARGAGRATGPQRAVRATPRRVFLGRMAALAAVSLVPRRVLGGAGEVAPSSKTTLAGIGMGSQGLQNLAAFLPFPEIQVVAVCDVNRESSGYLSWYWGQGKERRNGGREPARRAVEDHYAAQQRSGQWRGCRPYADYRELLARGEMPPVTLNWYDGGLRPPRPPELEPDDVMQDILYLGEKGKLMGERLIPESRMETYRRPPKTLARAPGHYHEFVAACRGGAPPGSNFLDHAGLLTEACLLGNVALRAQKKIAWDGAALRITNDEQANALLRRDYRAGWAI